MTAIASIHLSNTTGEVVSHPLHRKWLRSSGADEVVLQRSSLGVLTPTILTDFLLNREVPDLGGYDVIIFEPPAALYCAPLIRHRFPEMTLLHLHTTWRTAGLSAYDFESLAPHERYVYYVDRWLDEHILRWIHRRVLDGVITVSKMVASHVREFSQLPTKIVRPTIDADLLPLLSNVTPSLEDNTAVFVGANRVGHKGADMLVDVWPHVRDRVPDATLKIVGRGHPPSYDRVVGVSASGFVEDLSNVLGTASIQIHPARFDASPVSTLEGLRAGLPLIVSNRTGTRSEVRRVDPDFVVPVEPKAICERIVSYFESAIETREEYSEQARQIGAEFEESARAGEFDRTVDALVSKVQRESRS